ncbi:4262_t:CDS:10 [Ambispora gerdemannii]|uniref:4262_t:CDS:1 n=1 Tax=Ambispora gerdemannii TaxID=144530 RepID=A0A9N8WFE9_9GLOM|nr:4262_t:CDS:10 [Ambispora gerdemannii]
MSKTQKPQCRTNNYNKYPEYPPLQQFPPPSAQKSVLKNFEKIIKKFKNVKLTTAMRCHLSDLAKAQTPNESRAIVRDIFLDSSMSRLEQYALISNLSKLRLSSIGSDAWADKVQQYVDKYPEFNKPAVYKTDDFLCWIPDDINTLENILQHLENAKNSLIHKYTGREPYSKLIQDWFPKCTNHPFDDESLELFLDGLIDACYDQIFPTDDNESLGSNKYLTEDRSLQLALLDGVARKVPREREGIGYEWAAPSERTEVEHLFPPGRFLEHRTYIIIAPPGRTDAKPCFLHVPGAEAVGLLQTSHKTRFLARQCSWHPSRLRNLRPQTSPESGYINKKHGIHITMVGKCPGCGYSPRSGKTRDLDKHINLTGNLPPVDNQALNPEGDIISFNENPLTAHPPAREKNELAIDPEMESTDNGETIMGAYKRINNESEAIAKKNGKIDMRKSGNYTLTTIKFFKKTTLAPQKSKKISEQEGAWVDLATTGALIFAERYEGEAIQYDVNSMYVFEMMKKNVTWPIAPVTLMSISPNALIYERNARITGKEMFGEWSDILYNIKKEGGIAGKVASSRKTISEIVKPLKDQVKRIHTDGFIVAGQVNLKTGIEMGELNLEKRGICTVKNCITVSWEQPYPEIPNLITNNISSDLEQIQEEQDSKSTQIIAKKKIDVEADTKCKKELLAGIENLYNLYYELSKKERPMTEAEIEEATEDVLVDISLLKTKADLKDHLIKSARLIQAFNSCLKINDTWYAEARHELYMRHRTLRKQYWKMVSEREMEDKKFHNENDIWAYLEPDENVNNHINKMETLDGKCFEIFKAQVHYPVFSHICSKPDIRQVNQFSESLYNAIYLSFSEPERKKCPAHDGYQISGPSMNRLKEKGPIRSLQVDDQKLIHR